jgi:hypothetical protein
MRVASRGVWPWRFTHARWDQPAAQVPSTARPTTTQTGPQRVPRQEGSRRRTA